MRSARVASVLMAVVAALSLLGSCKITIPPFPWPSPSPSSSPTPEPSATPTPQPSVEPTLPPSPDPTPVPWPTPTPAPSATPTPCAEVAIPLDPVPVIQAGPCSAGTQRLTVEGVSVCLAPSSCQSEHCCVRPTAGCEYRPDLPYECRSLENRLGVALRSGDWTITPEGFVEDHPRGVLDAYGRRYRLHVTPSRASYLSDWEYSGVCAPARRVCPTPPPSVPPSTPPSSPPSPGPTPIPGPTPAPPCPPVVAIAANVAQHQTPQHQTWPHPWGLVGGTTNLDSTVKFERDCPVCACDSDHHNPCTVDGNAHVHHLVPAPTPENPGRMICTTYRHCEDRRGSSWSQTGGPSVHFSVENGDEGRGYGLNIGPFAEPGNYGFRVCVPQDWRDEEGYWVPVQSGACREVSFEVRP